MPGMRTELQSEASRRTAVGKARSSRNSSSDAFLAQTVVLECEDATRFQALLDKLRAELDPRNVVENTLVENLAVYSWRQRRYLAMEAACLTTEMRSQNAESDATEPGPAPKINDAVRTVRAFGSLAANSRVLETLNRYDAGLKRQYSRTLRSYLDLRSSPDMANKRPKN